jgi:hypothetical protein
MERQPVNRERPKATLRCPQCGFKVPLGDRQYAELQRRLRVTVSCTRCRLTFPYSAVGERASASKRTPTANQPAVKAKSSAPGLVLPSDAPVAPQMFAPTAEGPAVVPPALQIQMDADEEEPCLTVVEPGEEAPPGSLREVWRSLSAPARWLVVGAIFLSVALLTGATVYRLTSESPDDPPDAPGAR